MSEIDDTKQALIDAGLVLDYIGHGDMTRGHVSIRVPGQPDLFFMKAHSIGLDEITLENILTFNLESELVAGTAKPHSERYIHSEIYRLRPDVNAVIHSHPANVIALAATGKAIEPISQGGTMFEGALPVFDQTIDLIRTKAQGRAVAEALGQHNAVVMRGHGLAVTGYNVAMAVVLSAMLDEAAHIQLLAMAAGLDGWRYPADDVASLRAKLLSPEQWTVNFDYLVRRARKAAGRA